jgi:hypothetical protein
VVDIALELLGQPLRLVLVQHAALARLQHARTPGVHHDQARPVEVPRVAPPIRLRIGVGGRGEAVQQLGDVVDPTLAQLQHLTPDVVSRPFARREVAEVLVDPVGSEAAYDPLLPPRRRPHLLAPVGGGVPVVADVVVVEDHGARQGRQQPPVGRVAPGKGVEVGVLLEVLELLARAFLEAAPRRDELLHPVRRLVGIDLVA